MNHCMLEVLVKKAPTVRFTQDNKTPLAELEVEFDSLRADDPPCAIKVVGWGKLAEELQNTVQVNSKLVIEGRLRMNTVCLLYTSPSPRDGLLSRMPSSA